MRYWIKQGTEYCACSLTANTLYAGGFLRINFAKPLLFFLQSKKTY